MKVFRTMKKNKLFSKPLSFVLLYVGYIAEVLAEMGSLL